MFIFNYGDLSKFSLLIRLFPLALDKFLVGIFISHMSKRVKNFGLRPTYYMCLVLSMILFVLMALSVPEKATYQPTDAAPLLIAPRSVNIISQQNSDCITIDCTNTLDVAPYNSAFNGSM